MGLGVGSIDKQNFSSAQELGRKDGDTPFDDDLDQL